MNGKKDFNEAKEEKNGLTWGMAKGFLLVCIIGYFLMAVVAAISHETGWVFFFLGLEFVLFFPYFYIERKVRLQFSERHKPPHPYPEKEEKEDSK